MKDRIGSHEWWNRPLANPTQNIFVRFIRQPGSGLPDTMKEFRDKFEDFGKKALKTRLSEYLDD